MYIPHINSIQIYKFSFFFCIASNIVIVNLYKKMFLYGHVRQCTHFFPEKTHHILRFNPILFCGGRPSQLQLGRNKINISIGLRLHIIYIVHNHSHHLLNKILCANVKLYIYAYKYRRPYSPHRKWSTYIYYVYIIYIYIYLAAQKMYFVFSRTENQSQGTGCGILYTYISHIISCIFINAFIHIQCGWKHSNNSLEKTRWQNTFADILYLIILDNINV